jgi:galactokinase
MSIPIPDDRDLARWLERAGVRPDVAPGLRRRFDSLLAEFGAHRDDRRTWDLWFVPGRIEILGKHTDYAGGRSLTCAVERGLCVVSAPRNDGRIVVTDAGRRSSIALDADSAAPAVSWATYPVTMINRLRRNFPRQRLGADILFDSDLPSASGLSSSSALMIAVMLAVARAGRLDESGEWRANVESGEDLAAYAATVENGSGFKQFAGESGVGTRGGSEDHTAILCSRAGRLGQYAYRPTRHERTIALADELVLAVGVSGVRAQKTGNAREAYNRAARNVERILERWNGDQGRSDPTLAAAIASATGGAVDVRRLLGADERDLLDRFDQFVEESTVLVPRGGDLLDAGRLGDFGETVDRSQALAERALKNQVAETVALARRAREHGALAASAFGAGFGGSVWALVERTEAQRFLDRWQNAYAAAHAGPAARSSFFLSRPGPAAFRVSLEEDEVPSPGAYL